ncbi:hypothetical protein [Cryptosporangium phraense]|uniref:Uncharacterized protein n=1 Tax=Cryptosporangium phraense TaxID=2593070 RepID=A0A545ASX6_9ACTN|nr:hypothetical protein [Cryptosporangium phraense]TQS44351.1 hypothetical protein FL583_15575 [Cryptosporangium phraense]
MPTDTPTIDADEAVRLAEQERDAAQLVVSDLERRAGTDPQVDDDLFHRASDTLRRATAAVQNAIAGRDRRDTRARAEHYRQLGNDVRAFHATQASEVQIATDDAVRALETLYAAAEARNTTLTELMTRNQEAAAQATQHGEKLTPYGLPDTHLHRGSVLVTDTSEGKRAYRPVEPAALLAHALRRALQNERDRNGGAPAWSDEYESVLASDDVPDQFGLDRIIR